VSQTSISRHLTHLLSQLVGSGYTVLCWLIVRWGSSFAWYLACLFLSWWFPLVHRICLGIWAAWTNSIFGYQIFVASSRWSFGLVRWFWSFSWARRPCCSLFVWAKQRTGSRTAFLNWFWASGSLWHLALDHWTWCMTGLEWGALHGVYLVPLASIHGFYCCPSSSDWASRFKTLIVSVSFEIHLLPGLLCAVSSAVYPWVSTRVTTSHKAQLQWASTCFGRPARYRSSEASYLTKPSSAGRLWIDSWRSLHLSLVFALSWVFSWDLSGVNLTAASFPNPCSFPVEVSISASTAAVRSGWCLLGIHHWALTSCAFGHFASSSARRGFLWSPIFGCNLTGNSVTWAHYNSILFVIDWSCWTSSLRLSTRVSWH